MYVCVCVIEVSLISDSFHHDVKCDGLREDADMYVRLLRLISLKKSSSSLREKTLSDDPSDMVKFFLLMRKICETE